MSTPAANHLGRHVCSLYESENEKLSAAVTFVRLGVEQRQKSVYIAGDASEDRVERALQGNGLDVPRLLSSGALLISTPAKLRLRRDALDAYRLFSFWRSSLRQTHAQGFQGMCGTGETGALLGGAVPTDRWIEYENTLSEMTRDERCTFLCQYDRRFSTPAQIRQVLSTHACVLHAGDEPIAQPIQTLRATQSRLAHLTRNLNFGALANALTDDLGDHLASIAGHQEAASRALAADSPNLAAANASLASSLDAVRQAAFLVARVRSHARKPESNDREFDLNEAIEEVISLSIDELAGRGIRLRREFGGSLPPTRADRGQIQYVVLHLLTNAWEAIDAASDYKREILIRTALDETRQLRFAIRDSGQGLSAPALQRAFEPFYTTKPGALGLGLSTSREVLRAHRGDLWATANEAGFGPTTFQFTLPTALEP
jgi:signal transduction histidine kinase